MGCEVGLMMRFPTFVSVLADAKCLLLLLDSIGCLLTFQFDFFSSTFGMRPVVSRDDVSIFFKVTSAIPVNCRSFRKTV